MRAPENPPKAKAEKTKEKKKSSTFIENDEMSPPAEDNRRSRSIQDFQPSNVAFMGVVRPNDVQMSTN